MSLVIDQQHDLVTQCKSGNQDAFYRLYKLYAKSMYNVAVKILNDKDEAADILQDSFIQVFSDIKNFRQEVTFGLWLKRIVINQSITAIRKRKYDFVAIDSVSDEDLVDDNEMEMPDLKEEVVKINEGIRKLPDGFRCILTLFFLEGYDHWGLSQKWPPVFLQSGHIFRSKVATFFAPKCPIG
ncbi:sigma-70 family RNA polymerase sigma factor [Pedobacter sp. LMG 31464]|uniref:Sigma-70 family RNA polymerase sigma factor n=1 Tax=Pedobacter planticolens TaxID=2679964 RepID=A0A923DVR5_9SPHI|nr:sigma-70 family RNA polymerase sigma factor [Pedobacter planticolens]MBB2143936.1 sigma-70 family RNA polymerase sigma factor [Pedobacter planticolens]